MSAWSKIWQNIGWQNKPSRLTPLGKSNLDKLDTFNDAIDDRVVEIYNMKGSNNGLAELDANGFVPSTQLPSFVDDIIEGEAQNVTQESSGMFSATGFIKAGESSPTTLESNKVYLDTSRRIQFRWTGTGSNLVSIGSGLTLGETQFTAYRGDRGKTAYDHATDASRNTTTQQVGLYKFGVTSEGHVSSPTEMTAEDLQNAVGLGDVAFISTPENPTQVKYLREDGTWDVPEGQSIAGTQTATGNPITLTDASETYAQGLSVELEPKQDLHGQSAPYVGGTGKNKFDEDTAYSDYALGNGEFSTGGSSHAVKTYIPQSLVNKELTFSAYFKTTVQNVSYRVKAVVGGSGYNGNVINSANVTELSKITFTPTSTNDYVCIDYNTGVSGWNNGIVSKFQLEEGSTATDFAPYSNICPITGYTECEVDDVGKNKLHVTASTSEIDHVKFTVGSDGSINIKRTDADPDNATFTMASGVVISSAMKFNCGVVPDWNGTGFVVFAESSGQNYEISSMDGVELPSGTYDFKIMVQTGKDPNMTIYPMIRLATEIDPIFVPYHSSNATIQFGQTVYGGKSNFTEGGTSDEYASVDLGSLEWNMPVSGGFSAQLTLSKSGICSLLCSVYGYDDSVSFAWNKFDTLSDKTIFRNNSQTIIYCKDTTYTDATAFKTAVIGQQLVYELATPTTIDTPPTNLKLLQGTNNITTNGTTITLDYIPNNSIGDAVKASEEYTDRVVERVIPKATLIDTWMISEESDTISVDLTSYDCNFFLLEYLFQSKRGTTLIPRPQGGSFSASVVTYNNGTPYYIELDYNPTTKELAYTSNVTSQFGVLALYTI